MDKNEHQSKFHLSVTNTHDTCLDASAGRRQTASEIRFHMFSTCRWHAKQVRSLLSPLPPQSFQQRTFHKVLLTDQFNPKPKTLQCLLSTGQVLDME